jgi:hypothetical protein
MTNQTNLPETKNTSKKPKNTCARQLRRAHNTRTEKMLLQVLQYSVGLYMRYLAYKCAYWCTNISIGVFLSFESDQSIWSIRNNGADYFLRPSTNLRWGVMAIREISGYNGINTHCKTP